MSHFKPSKNYTKLLASLYFNIPGFVKIPRAPDAYTNRDLVDVYTAKRRLELVHRLPKIKVDALHTTYMEASSNPEEPLDRHFLTSLIMAGYSSVVDELVALTKEEKSFVSDRSQSFAEDKPLLEELVKGLIACADSENSDKVTDRVRLRKSLGEKMVLREEFWLARKMFAGAFNYLQFYDNDDLDKLRVELWCLLSYICIYFEESQQIGYDLPTKCLTLAQQMCRGKPWCMPKSVMNIYVPKTIYVYGLRNEWIKIKSDWVNMYIVVTTLLHVLYVKKARFWQEELRCLDCRNYASDDGTLTLPGKQKQRLKANIADALTYALAYADEVRLNSGFVATTLRRGLFFEEQGDWEKAMEDFNAMHVLALNFDDFEATSMALNRIAQNHKLSGNAEMAMDCYAHQWEISCENEYEELQADALVDLGVVLLEEGQTWEADECVAQSNTLFRHTKQNDTPNDLDELTWALMGVTRGQHLWGRYCTLIRTQERSNINAINAWKSSRKGFPIASMPPKWYKTQLRADFEKQYEAAIPKPEKVRKSSFQVPRSRRVVDFAEDDDEDKTRRLFEFTPKEVEKRPTMWYQEKGYGDMFGFINASSKPRVVPQWDDGQSELWNSVNETLSEMRMKGSNDHDTVTKQRKHEASEKALRIGQSMRFSMKGRKTITEKDMADWIKHDFRVSTWKKQSKSLDRWKTVLNPNAAVGERLVALLDDMEQITNVDDNYDRLNRNKEEEDESDDTELMKHGVKKSRRSSSFMREYKSFNEKDLGF